jgi:hypothetical protein
MFIRTQKSLHGWRQFLIDVLAQVESSDSINTKMLLSKYPPESVSKEKPPWGDLRRRRNCGQLY